MERYARQTILPEVGVKGQNKLANASVVVVGAGGLGCPALMYLASSGIGHITIIDDDIIDETNLQRQILYTTADCGRPKVEIAALQLQSMNPSIKITAHQTRLTEQNAAQLLKGYDVILDGSDNFETRYLVNDIASHMGIAVVFASITGFEGQITVFPMDGVAPCYRCLYPKQPQANIRNCAEAGAIGAVAGIIGSTMALEAMKLILNVESLKTLTSRLLIVDGRTMEISKVPVQKRVHCKGCSNPLAAAV